MGFSEQTKKQSALDSWLFRSAMVSDLDQIMLIENTVFPDDAWSSELMTAELNSTNSEYIVATTVNDLSEIVGYLGLFVPTGQFQADVMTVAVSPKFRRKGIGKAILELGIERCRQLKFSELFLEVRVDNFSAIRLYERLGFEKIGIRKGYYAGVDAVSMRLIISERGTELTK